MLGVSRLHLCRVSGDNNNRDRWEGPAIVGHHQHSKDKWDQVAGRQCRGSKGNILQIIQDSIRRVDKDSPHSSTSSSKNNQQDHKIQQITLAGTNKSLGILKYVVRSMDHLIWMR